MTLYSGVTLTCEVTRQPRYSGVKCVTWCSDGNVLHCTKWLHLVTSQLMGRQAGAAVNRVQDAFESCPELLTEPTIDDKVYCGL